MGKDVSVVLISGTNDLGAFDRLAVDDTATGGGTGWQERTIAGDLGYLLISLSSPRPHEEAVRLVSEAASHLIKRGWSGLVFTMSDGQTVAGG